MKAQEWADKQCKKLTDFMEMLARPQPSYNMNEKEIQF